MKKSDLIKNALDKRHDQFLEEYRNLFYLLIGMIIAYVTSEVYSLNMLFQLIFFDAILFVLYLIVLQRKRLSYVRKEILKIEIESPTRKKVR